MTGAVYVVNIDDFELTRYALGGKAATRLAARLSEADTDAEVTITVRVVPVAGYVEPPTVDFGKIDAIIADLERGGRKEAAAYLRTHYRRGDTP
jgi:hypothetical protein